MKGVDTNGLKWRNDKYQQRQYSSQHREWPVASFGAQIAQATNRIESHRGSPIFGEEAINCPWIEHIDRASAPLIGMGAAPIDVPLACARDRRRRELWGKARCSVCTGDVHAL